VGRDGCPGRKQPKLSALHWMPVEQVVTCGLEHSKLGAMDTIGVDELQPDSGQEQHVVPRLQSNGGSRYHELVGR